MSKRHWNKREQELIEEFLKDLTYIDTVNIPSTSPTNVFVRIQKIKDKWEKVAKSTK